MGLSNAMLLAMYNEVVTLASAKIALLSGHQSPVAAIDIEDFLSDSKIDFTALVEAVTPPQAAMVIKPIMPPNVNSLWYQAI